jgi:hypothetical protein
MHQDHKQISESPQKSSQRVTISRDTVLIGIFGALWGLMEITIGLTLKGLRIPMGGAILTAISCVIFLTGRSFINQRGSIFLMGAVAATMKVFSVGTVIAGPFMAILIEAGMAEILVSLLGINRFSYTGTSIILCLYTIVHPFIAQGIIFGDDIYRIYLETFRTLSLLFNIDLAYLVWIIIFYAFIHIILGFMAGWLAYSLSIRVDQELSRTL